MLADCQLAEVVVRTVLSSHAEESVPLDIVVQVSADAFTSHIESESAVGASAQMTECMSLPESSSTVTSSVGGFVPRRPASDSEAGAATCSAE